MDDIPDFFADGARLAFGIPGVALVFTRSIPTLDDAETPKPPEPMAIVRMSPQMAEQLIALLSRALETVQKQAEEAPLGGRIQEQQTLP
jgi:hypothetical protein